MKLIGPVNWFGGKSRFASKIVSYFPPHITYVEPFGGCASVLLAKEASRHEVYNDLDGRLVNLFQVLRDKDSASQLRRSLENTLYAREEFELAGCPDPTDPVEAARRFFVRQMQSFSGFGRHWSVSVKGTGSGVTRWEKGIARLMAIHDRIKRVQIERRDWLEITGRFDRADTLFYLDPPYIHSTRVDGKYKHELSDGEHECLVSRLLDLQGMAILSGYRHPLYEPLERHGWSRIEFDVLAYSSPHRAHRTECLWISPHAQERYRQVPEESCLRKGARITHRIRSNATRGKILTTIAVMRDKGQKPTITSVAALAGVSREHLSRRYRDLFKM